MTVSPHFRQIGIIGTGRVAAALARGFAAHSVNPVCVLGRSQQRVAAFSNEISGTGVVEDNAALLAQCDVIAIEVADDALATVVAGLAQTKTSVRSAPFVFHVSGRSGVSILAPLAVLGAEIAAIHPVMTFTGDGESEVRRMAGARFAVTSGSAVAKTMADQIVRLLGGVPVEIAEQHRALYHAGLSHAANHLVTLLAGSTRALAMAGVDDPAALLGPLVRAALENSLAHGFSALSGPLRRGDVQTIRQHLDALTRDCPELLPAYRTMALGTLDELARSGAEPAPDLRAVLSDPPLAPDPLPRSRRSQ